MCLYTVIRRTTRKWIFVQFSGWLSFLATQSEWHTHMTINLVIMLVQSQLNTVYTLRS